MRCACRTGFLLCAAAVSCSSARFGGPDAPAPGVTLPVSFAEGTTGKKERASTADAGTKSEDRAEAERRRLAARRRAGSLPDPEPLRVSDYWRYEIVYDRGQLRIERVERVHFAKPVSTPRLVGRYAVELWIGGELVDRVSFDFPLLGAEPVQYQTRHPLAEPPTLAKGALVSRQILVPASPRATRAALVDRATGESHDLPWPPDRPLGTARAALTPTELQRLRAAPAESRADAGTQGAR